MKKQGFTLIELLIVVAIIAILAAIAIPNFLQAQTRAKISRAQSDMRAIATGIESYYVDHNAYPETRAGFAELITPSSVYGLFRLTTPTAYITNIPDSPFIEEFGRGVGDPAPVVPDRNIFLFVSRTDFIPDRNETRRQELMTDALAYMGENAPLSSIMWELKSVGPNQRDDMNLYYQGEIDQAAPYDPTNGTISAGDIVWFGPGFPPSF